MSSNFAQIASSLLQFMVSYTQEDRTPTQQQKQACKPQNYASSKLCRQTDQVTGVKCILESLTTLAPTPVGGLRPGALLP